MPRTPESPFMTHAGRWYMVVIRPHNHDPAILFRWSMKRRTYRTPGGRAKCTTRSIAAILISSIGVWSAGRVSAHAENCSVEIVLAAADHKVIAQGSRLVDPQFLSVTIRNVGHQTVTLVQPGDGSESGLRTPTVSWVVRAADGNVVLQHIGTRDDNLINPLAPKEVFTLKPNAEHGFSHWIPLIVVDGPGKYVIALHYVNDPHLKWKGTPMRAHDAPSMELVTESSFCDAVSNPI